MITVIGSVNMDLIASTEHLPQPGETVTGANFSTAPGGKGANQALAARRAGASVRMVGAVGDDHFADDALALLGEAGIDLSGIQRLTGASGTALILVGNDGENMIAIIPAANGKVSASHAQEAVDAMADSDTLILQMEIAETAIEAALKAARLKGIRSILNIAPLKNAVEHLAPLADIVIANETEFARLCGTMTDTVETTKSALAAHHARTRQSMIVTLGGDGVVFAHEGRVGHTPSICITPLDSVGAGDTFCGYFAQALDAGIDFSDAIKRAAVAGALACLKPGAQPSIPLAADVEKRL